MNLYKIMFDHYAPKDSERGIITYLIANSDEDVYEWIKSEPDVTFVGNLYNSWKYHEEEREYDVFDNEYNVIGTETFKERMIKVGGEMFDEDADVSDSYYGVTHLGWDLVQENIFDVHIEVLLHLGIAIKI